MHHKNCFKVFFAPFGSLDKKSATRILSKSNSSKIPVGRWSQNLLENYIARGSEKILLADQNQSYFAETSQCVHCGSGWSEEERYLLIITLVPPMSNLSIRSSFMKERQLRYQNINQTIKNYFKMIS